MKMPKEYVLVVIVGLFLLAYLLEAVVDPLAIPLTTPYQFFSAPVIGTYPFTAAIIAIRTLALVILPLWLFSFLTNYFQLKAVVLFICSVLLELYSVQQIVTGTRTIPLEWAISFAGAGIILAFPTLIFFLKGLVKIKTPHPANYTGSLVDDDDDEY